MCIEEKQSRQGDKASRLLYFYEAFIVNAKTLLSFTIKQTVVHDKTDIDRLRTF